MKKIIFTVSIIILVNTTTKGQIDNSELQSKPRINIQLPTEHAEKSLAEIFSTANVIDARDDTSFVGFYSTGSDGKNWPKLYVTFPSTSESLTEWIKSYLDLSTKSLVSQSKLLVVIKKLWLSSEAVPSIDQNDKKVQPKMLGYDPGLVTKLEFYLERDSIFYPLYKCDSIFTYKDELPENAAYYFTESLKQSLKRLFRINFTEVFNRGRKLTIGEIFSANSEISNVEIVKATKFNKGVYKNFIEFKSNSPSISNYELRAGAMGDVLYVKENGTEYPLRTAWGFCDGNDLFINSSDKYSKLIKRQNSFYFLGIKGIERKSKHDILHTSLLNLANDTGRKHTGFSKTVKYFKIDIETGDAY